MRLSTAITFALTALLVTSVVGVAAAAPSASAPAPQTETTAPDRSPLEPRAYAVDSPPASDGALQFPTPSRLSAQFPAQSGADSLSESTTNQEIRISIDENGDARWTIESRFVLTSDEEVDAFREYAAAVAAGERDVTFDRQLFEHRVSEVADRTGREMSFENAGWDEPRIEPLDETADSDGAASEDGETVRIGTISYSFTWTNFAATENGRIHVGDAFRSDTGVWFSLADSQRLVIESPSDYALETPSDLKWEGPHQFSEEELTIVFVRASGPAAGITESHLAAVGILVLLVGIGSYLFARRNPAVDLPTLIDRLPDRVAKHTLVRRLQSYLGPDRPHRGGRTTANTDGGSMQSPSEPGPDSSRVDSSALASSGTELEFEESVDDEVDPELLSDEERVLRLLKQNGGRMKQGSIVSETGWSNAKVSQLLSQMDDDDEIEKLRIGRENLITLPEVDPTELD